MLENNREKEQQSSDWSIDPVITRFQVPVLSASCILQGVPSLPLYTYLAVGRGVRAAK